MSINYSDVLARSSEYDAAFFGSWGTNSIEYTFLTYIPSYYYNLASPTLASVWLSTATTVITGISVGVEDFAPFTDVQKEAVQYILLDKSNVSSSNSFYQFLEYRVSFADVTNVSITEKAQLAPAPDDIGDITFFNATLINHDSGFTSTANTSVFSGAGDVFLDPQNDYNGDSQLYYGGVGFWAALHESMHAITGVRDLGGMVVYPDTPPVLGTSLAGTQYDDMKYTIMSYGTDEGEGLREALITDHNDGFRVVPYGLQLLDIAKTQDEFGGRNYSTRDGDTTYGANGHGFAPLGTDKPFLYTIWDGKGIDKIDASDFTVAAQIDLRQGAFSSIGKYSASASNTAHMAFDDGNDTNGDEGNVAIAFYTVIENAKGTEKDDILIGNAWDNKLEGGDGNDTIYGDGQAYDKNDGFIADDPYRAWNTTDNVKYASDLSGNDTLIGGTGKDGVYGGAGNDTLIASANVAGTNLEDDLYDGGAGTDTVDYSGLTFGLYAKQTAPEVFEVTNPNSPLETVYTPVITGPLPPNFVSIALSPFLPMMPMWTLEQQAAVSNAIATNTIPPATSLPPEIVPVFYNVSTITHTDTVQNVENYVLTSHADYIELNAPTAGVERHFDGGANTDGTDKINYIDPVRDDKTGIIWNKSATGKDVLTGFEEVVNSVDGTIKGMLSSYAIPDETVSYTVTPGVSAIGGQVVDYSTSSSAVTLNAMLAYSGVSGMTASLSGGVNHLMTDNSHVVGSDRGDNLTLSGSFNFTYGFRYDTGLGNDTIVINASGAPFVNWIGAPVIGYSGGNDTISTTINSYINSSLTIAMAQGIGRSDVTWSAIQDAVVTNSMDVVLTIAGKGNLTINNLGLFGSTPLHVTFANGDKLDILPGSHTDTLASVVVTEYYGRWGNDTMKGYGNADEIFYGRAGNDIIDGGKGKDTLVGGVGNDTYVVDDIGDNVIEYTNQGTDTVLSSVDYTLGEAVENVTLTGTLAINATGNSGNNILIGNSAANILAGGAGDDTYVVDNIGDVVIELVNGGNDTVQSSVTYTLSANVENITLTGTTAINGTGNELDNILTGNSAANVLTGGLGNDIYYVSIGDTVVENANEGIDTVQANVTHTLAVNVENLTLIGTAAINGTGNSADNIITGNAASNVLDGGVGADTLIGGLGNDRYVVDNIGDVVTEKLNEGTDTVSSSITWTLGANLENLTLTGTAAINGTGNTLNNVLTGNAAVNTLTGGLGNDTYVVTAGDVVVENLNEGTDTISSGITWVLGNNLENLTLTGTAAINGTGNALNNILTGNSAANILAGGLGNDLYYVGTGDTVTENLNEGTDTVASGITWTLGANFENLTLTGTAAINATGNTLNNVLTGNAAVNTLTGGLGNDTYVVTAGDVVVENLNEGIDIVSSAITWALGANLENLTLTGASVINATGNELANILTGNSAANVLSGGLGNDLYYVGTGDTVTENLNEGTDTVSAGITWTLGANLENLTLTGTAAINGTGNTLDNILTGNSAINTLTGGTGNDTYVVSSGDIIVENLNEGTDTVQAGFSYTLGANIENLLLTGTGSISGAGNALDNAITGNAAVNALNGNDGNDTLNGMAGNDILNGGNGNDTLIGGAGADTLTGGAGADTFKFDIASVGSIDTIADFSTSQGDKLDIHDILVGYNPVSSAITAFLEITDSGVNSLVKVDRDGAGTAYGWAQVATLSNVTGLTDETALLAAGRIVV